MTNLSDIVALAQKQIQEAASLSALETIRVDLLGKKGQLTELLKQLGSLSPEERPRFGQAVNEAKAKVQTWLTQQKEMLEAETLRAQLASERIDITLPGRKQQKGSLHPVTLAKKRLSEIFMSQGYAIVDGPEIEDEFYNFTALNMDEYHPARAMQDTFYFSGDRLLRTHMSPVQIRTMQTAALPLRVVAMGRVYRSDFDLTHTPMFHQMEVMLIDKNVSMAHLKGTIISFLRDFFEKDMAVRFRPSYFPFTEPSAEVDIECTNCEGKGCRVCSSTGWLEVLGSGMIHPNVLRAGGVDPSQYNGFAFGVGIDRLAMLNYKINDLRMLFENDLKFLRQF